MTRSTLEYQEGYAAGKRGEEPSANPYQSPYHTEREAVRKSVDWICGFSDAWLIRSRKFPE